MDQHRVWDRSNQMPPGREFEAYHFVEGDVIQFYEIELKKASL